MITRRICILLFFIVIANNIIGENVSDYSPQLIQKINVGRSEGELGFEPSLAGSPSSPYTFIISKEHKILIPDIINNRINIYDLLLKNTKTIDNINECRYARKMDVDDSGNIYCLIGGETGLIKIDPKGKLIYQIDRYSLPKNVYNTMNFFIIDNVLFFYDDNNKIKLIDDKGEIKNNAIAKQKILELTLARQKLSFCKDTQQIELSKENTELFAKIKNELEFLIICDCFYNADFYKTKEYFEKIEKIRKEVNISNKVNETEKKKNFELNLNNFSGLSLLGYDKDYNSYWESLKILNNNNNKTQTIIIYSIYGELIDMFYYGEYKKRNRGSTPDRSVFPTSGAKVAVSWDGDLYFMCAPLTLTKSNDYGTFNTQIIGEKAYYFYKIERQW